MKTRNVLIIVGVIFMISFAMNGSAVIDAMSDLIEATTVNATYLQAKSGSTITLNSSIDANGKNITGAANITANITNGVVNAAMYATVHDALNATPTGGSLYFPKGNYSTVNLNVSKYMHIYGDGIESNLSSYTDGSSVIIVSNHYSTIENIGITTGSNVTGITVDSFLLTLGVVDNRFKNIRFFGNGNSRDGMFYYGNNTHVPTTQYLESLYWGGYNTSLNVSKGYITCVNCVFEESTTGLYTDSGAWVTLIAPWFEIVTNATYGNCGGDITIIQPKYTSVTNKYQENTACGYRTNYHVIGGDENWILPRWDNLSAQGTVEGSIGYNYTSHSLNIRDDNRWCSGYSSIGIGLDNGTSVIPVGIQEEIKIPWAATITGASIMSRGTGNLEMQFWIDSKTNYPPTVADLGGRTLTMTGANSTFDTTLSGWTTAVSKDDVIWFNVSAVPTVWNATVQLDFCKN